MRAEQGPTPHRMKEDWDDRAREDVYRYVDHHARIENGSRAYGLITHLYIDYKNRPKYLQTITFRR